MYLDGFFFGTKQRNKGGILGVGLKGVVFQGGREKKERGGGGGGGGGRGRERGGGGGGWVCARASQSLKLNIARLAEVSVFRAHRVDVSPVCSGCCCVSPAQLCHAYSSDPLRHKVSMYLFISNLQPMLWLAQCWLCVWCS